MNAGLNNRVITFIGLFFIASISLHAFAHIDESPIEDHHQIQCQSCHNDVSEDTEIAAFVPKDFFNKPEDLFCPKLFDFQANKPFNSQAPPKITI